MTTRARDIKAEHRGLCIHSLRLALRGRHDHHDTSARKLCRLRARIEIGQLRTLGYGAVVQPECGAGGFVGEPIAWWGPRS